MTEQGLDDVIRGLDSARRVAWAKYYEEKRRNDELAEAGEDFGTRWDMYRDGGVPWTRPKDFDVDAALDQVRAIRRSLRDRGED